MVNLFFFVDIIALLSIDSDGATFPTFYLFAVFQSEVRRPFAERRAHLASVISTIIVLIP